VGRWSFRFHHDGAASGLGELVSRAPRLPVLNGTKLVGELALLLSEPKVLLAEFLQLVLNVSGKPHCFIDLAEGLCVLAHVPDPLCEVAEVFETSNGRLNFDHVGSARVGVQSMPATKSVAKLHMRRRAPDGGQARRCVRQPGRK